MQGSRSGCGQDKPAEECTERITECEVNRPAALSSRVNAIKSGLGIAATEWSQIKEQLGQVTGQVSITPIPQSTINNLRSSVNNASSVLDKIKCVPPKPPKPKPPKPELGPVTLDLVSPPGTADVKAMVTVMTPQQTPLKGANVTVYYDRCPAIGACATNISQLKDRGKTKSGTTDASGTTPVWTLATGFGVAFERLYAFAEVRYKGTLTQTPVKSIGGLAGLTTRPSPEAITRLKAAEAGSKLKELGLSL